MGIFKSYDIRGIFGTEWDAGTARRIGLALPGLISAREIVVGRDARLSSPEIFEALSSGIRDAGAGVADIGVCDTPAVYFATARYGFDGGVMITASHNPPEYNGLKISRRDAVPVGYETGLSALEAAVGTGSGSGAAGADAPAGRAAGAAPSSRGGSRRLDIRADYLEHLSRFLGGDERQSAVIDCSNGTVGVYLRDILSRQKGRFELIFEEPDGRFPNHPPNPLVEANLAALKAQVLTRRAGLGVCFDGDADRVMFVDESGAFVSPDLVIALIGGYYFRHNPGRLAGGSRTVTYDVRTSRAVVEALREMGAEPAICRVGHSYAKRLLRETGGICGGELAGHYYFRENYFCDSGMIAALVVLSVLAREGRPLSELIRGIRRYASSGELNFTVPNGKEIVARVAADYPAGELTDIDGVRLDFPTWWFNLRTSNTEPLLRLVVEAETEGELAGRKAELVGKISRFAGGAVSAAE
jgi:phosphomannomutase